MRAADEKLIINELGPKAEAESEYYIPYIRSPWTGEGASKYVYYQFTKPEVKDDHKW